MESESGAVNTAKKGPKTSKSPGDTLNSTVRPLATSDHNTVLNDVTKSKTKTRKKRKKNAPKNATKKAKKRKTKSTKTVTKGDLKPTGKKASKNVGKDAIEGLQTPRNTNNTAIKSDLGGSHVMGANKVIPDDVLWGNEGEPEEQIHAEDIKVSSSVEKVDVAWEHLSLLVEEYLLAIDVQM